MTSMSTNPPITKWIPTILRSSPNRPKSTPTRSLMELATDRSDSYRLHHPEGSARALKGCLWADNTRRADVVGSSPSVTRQVREVTPLDVQRPEMGARSMPNVGRVGV